MNNTLVEYFVSSSKTVLESFGIQIAEGEATIRRSPYKASNLVVVIGVTGNLHGQAMINFDQDTACRIASTMMGGMPVEMDEITKSAIAELSNMIIGNAVTLLSQHNILIDITPPSVLTGDNIHISTSLLNISIPIEMMNLGWLEFSITAKELS